MSQELSVNHVNQRPITVYERYQWHKAVNGSHKDGTIIDYQLAFDSSLDIARLNQALRRVLNSEFGVLSGRFVTLDGQLVWLKSKVPAQVLLESVDPAMEDAQLQIEPDGGALYCFRYFLTGDQKILVNLAFSHCVFDGLCHNAFLDALEQAWKSIDSKISNNEPPVSSPFTDDLDSGSTLASELFWQEYLGETGVSHRFEQLPRLNAEQASPCEYTLRLDVEKSEQLISRASHSGVSLFQTVSALFAATVTYLDIGLGKQKVNLAHTVNLKQPAMHFSCWANFIPMILTVDTSTSWTQLLMTTKQERAKVRQYQHVPSQVLLDQVATHFTDGRAFNLSVNESPVLLSQRCPQLTGVECEYVKLPSSRYDADLSLSFCVDENTIMLKWDANGERLTPFLLKQLAFQFERAVDAFIANLEKSIGASLREGGELFVVKGAQHDDEYQDLTELLFPNKIEWMDAIAASDAQGQYTYACVQDIALQLQSRFRSANSRKVGVLLPRTRMLPAVYIACILSGITFVPIESSLSESRISTMCEVAEVDTLICDVATKIQCDGLSFSPENLIDISDIKPSGKSALTLEQLPMWQDDPSQTAYIMFTSGSSGVPKGASISRRNLSVFLTSMHAMLEPQTNDCFASITALSFDISLLEILLPFVCGGQVVMAGERERIDGVLLSEWLHANHITFLQATPSSWRMLQEAEWYASCPMTLLSGGEAMSPQIEAFLLSQPAEIYNVYGPTECTIWSSVARLYRRQPVSLGTPVFGTDYAIVEPLKQVSADRKFSPVPSGGVGELIIIGDCVGQGYLNAADEFSFFALEDGRRAYATGDLVREFAPGQIHYIGRKDNQIKLNGHRIELEEINHAVRAIDPQLSVFTVLKQHHLHELVCYVYHPNNPTYQTQDLATPLSHKLPEYMLPSRFELLTSIPTTPNGKVDYKYLLGLDDKLEVGTKTAGHSDNSDHKTDQNSNHNAESEFTDLNCDNAVEYLQRLIAKHFKIEVRDPEKNLGYYGLNSLSFNILSAALKKSLDITFPSYEFYRLNTLTKAADKLLQLLGKNAEKTDGIANFKVAEKVSSLGPNEQPVTEKIAIVGIDAMLPCGKEGASDLQHFWQELMLNRDAVWRDDLHKICSERGYSQTTKLPRAAYICGVDEFDARFFGISPREASLMDPRQRLLLQSVWRTIENAGYAKSALKKTNTACYIAAVGIDYALRQARDNAPQQPHSITGHSLSILAHRISAFFDFRGASATIDTACSGSLVAIVKAVKDLLRGDADIAIAGGINLLLDTQIDEGLQVSNFMSPEARCATFDHNADGYVRGEGVGTVMLKRLSDAQRDNDSILAVVEAAVENHGGTAHSLTAPNPEAQQQLLESAYNPSLLSNLDYIETHGTGTQLGDPIEVGALQRAFKQFENEIDKPFGDKKIVLGAVKSQIGHLEAAAGIASVCKVIFSMRNQCIPPNLHFEGANSQLLLDDSEFVIPTAKIPWPARDTSRVAGISSFGFGGSNAHLVLSDAHRLNSTSKSSGSEPVVTAQYSESFKNPSWIVPVSAASLAALENRIKRLYQYLAKEEGLAIGDIAFTSCIGREALKYRLCFVVTSVSELTRLLGEVLEEGGQRPISNLKPMASTDIEPLSLRAIEAFLSGELVDWTPHFEERQVRRCHLPVYTFDKGCYWYKATDKQKARKS